MSPSRSQSRDRSAARRGPAPSLAPTAESGIARRTAGYLSVTVRPLHVLAFVLPLVVLYEIGASMYLGPASGGTVDNIRAHSIMLGVFQDLGVVGRFLPAILLVVVLLIWHAMTRDRWRIRPAYLAGMGLESLVWTVPLLVLVALVQLALGSGSGPPPAAVGADASTASIWALSPQARVTISLGAGIYEELLFRMIGIAILHAILVDLLRIEHTTGTMIAVFLSAVAFAIYHDVSDASGQVLWGKAISLMVAGIYFGIVYVLRGFGLVVAVHALYDIFVLVILRPS